MSKTEKPWWQRPGLGIQFQIEARPGWLWNRNYDKFITSMTDKHGNLRFNGPYCKMKDWVAFAKKVGVDYQMLESKWHDGICWFDTKYTKWKTPIDYCKIYAEESQKAHIPFTFYYSSIFDHNPQFNDIQPLRTSTPSFIAMHSLSKAHIVFYSFIFSFFAWVIRYFNDILIKKLPQQEKTAKFFDKFHFNTFTYNPKKYERYMLRQMTELIENYHCDGLWLDWWQVHTESSADVAMDYMQQKYPDKVLAYNNSIKWTLRYAHYLSFEAHSIGAAWKTANQFRNINKPWELICPASMYWDNPKARTDPLEDTRMAAVIMACGAKVCFGIPSLMDGNLYPESSHHIEILGDWYKPRRSIFIESVPMKYKGNKVPGIKIPDKEYGSIGCIKDKDYILHFVKFKKTNIPLSICFSHKYWKNIKKIYVEPQSIELPFKPGQDTTELLIPQNYVDSVDTILRISM